MMFKLIGAIFIVASCGGFGFTMAMRHRREVGCLEAFISSLDYMECELGYRLTPLPDLCRKTAISCGGDIGFFYSNLTKELEAQIYPNMPACFRHALSNSNLPPRCTAIIEKLGVTMGEFTLEGQLRGIDSVRKACEKLLSELTQDQSQRLRNYQTLGLCAGAALAILLV